MSSTHQPRARGILWTISRRLAMVIVLSFAFVLSATLTIYVLFRSGDTRVPSLAGKPEAEARKIAEKAGLRVKIQRRADASVPDGSVIETRPSQNSSVKKDSNLTIVVSSGPVQTKSELPSRPRNTERGMGSFRYGFSLKNTSEILESRGIRHSAFRDPRSALAL